MASEVVYGKDYQDGYSSVNANRFCWLWFDAFCFDETTLRTMIIATPTAKLDAKSLD